MFTFGKYLLKSVSVMKIKFVLSALVLGSVAMFLSSCNKDDFSIKGSWKAYKTTTECYVDDDLIYSKDSTLLRGPWYVFDDSTVTIIQEDKYGDRYSSTMAYEYSDGKLYINSVYTKGYAFQYEDGWDVKGSGKKLTLISRTEEITDPSTINYILGSRLGLHYLGAPQKIQLVSTSYYEKISDSEVPTVPIVM